MRPQSGCCQSTDWQVRSPVEFNCFCSFNPVALTEGEEVQGSGSS
jgi:hypothetical protein